MGGAVTRPRRMAALSMVAGMFLIASGCGKGKVLFTGEESTTTTVAGATPATTPSALPFAIQRAKVINVGSDIAYPPMESFQAGTQTPQGVDVDIANALGQKL